MLTATFLQNRVITKRYEITPYEGWKGRKPNVNFLRTWGCLAKVNIPLQKKRKLGPKTVDCVLLGYAHNSTAYRFLVVKSETSEIIVNTIMESRDASFFEDIYPTRTAGSASQTEDNQTMNNSNFEPTTISEPTSEIPPVCDNPEEDNNLVEEAPRRSKRQRVEKTFGEDFIVYLLDDVPNTLSEAYALPDAEYWKEAVHSEMDSIMANGTWEITDRPIGCKPLGCKWIFKKKMRSDGTIDKYKARLVAKGYTQKEGEDYFDTYSPVARLTTIRVLIALASSHSLHIHQMDVKTAFLNGELEEEIYMEQPDGFVISR